MADPLTIQRAVRFLERVYAFALRDGTGRSLANWISVKDSNPENSALRRGPCLAAIRAVNDDPVHDIFSEYPGATEDLYYQAALDAFLPAVRDRAKSDALATLNKQELMIGGLLLPIQNADIARRLRDNAIKVKRVGGILNLPLTVKAEYPTLTPEQMRQVVEGSSGTVMTRLKRTIYMREVRGCKDPLLFQLMVPPNGVSLVDAFAKGIIDGQQAAAETLNACRDAVIEMRATLIEDPESIWKFRPPLSTASAKIAQNVGQPGAALALAQFSLSWAQHEKGAVRSALDVANNAVMALGLLGPVGALAADILGVVLATIDAAVSVLDEMQQDQAAMATTFADDGDKLSKGGKTGVAVLKGVASIVAAAAPAALARVVGHTARTAETVEHDVETTAAGDMRAISNSVKAAEPDAKAIERGLLSKEPSVGRELQGNIKARGSPMAEQNVTQAKPVLPEAHDQAVELETAHGTGSPGIDRPATGKLPETPASSVSKPAADAKGAGTKSPVPVEKADDFKLAEFEGPDIPHPTEAQVEQARKALAGQLEQMVKQGIIDEPNFARFKLSPAQEDTFARLNGVVLADSKRALPEGLSAERAVARQTAEDRAMDLRRRVAVHWDAALPGLGNQKLSAKQAAAKLLNNLTKTPPTKGTMNAAVREKLYNNWRGRFIDRIAGDQDLIRDLKDWAGVTFTPKGSKVTAFRVQAIDRQGNLVWVDLNWDHAFRHEEAVDRAIRTGDPTWLETTVDSANLSANAALENQVVKEDLNKRNEGGWTVAPGPTPRAIQPYQPASPAK